MCDMKSTKILSVIMASMLFLMILTPTFAVAETSPEDSSMAGPASPTEAVAVDTTDISDPTKQIEGSENDDEIDSSKSNASAYSDILAVYENENSITIPIENGVKTEWPNILDSEGNVLAAISKPLETTLVLTGSTTKKVEINSKHQKVVFDNITVLGGESDSTSNFAAVVVSANELEIKGRNVIEVNDNRPSLLTFGGAIVGDGILSLASTGEYGGGGGLSIYSGSGAEITDNVQININSNGAGISGNAATISGNAKVNIESTSEGIYGGVTISEAADITINAGSGIISAFNDPINIWGGNVQITGEYGLYTLSSDINISGGTLNVDAERYAISANGSGNVNISGGFLYVQGITTDEGELVVTGGWTETIASSSGWVGISVDSITIDGSKTYVYAGSEAAFSSAISMEGVLTVRNGAILELERRIYSPSLQTVFRDCYITGEGAIEQDIDGYYDINGVRNKLPDDFDPTQNLPDIYKNNLLLAFREPSNNQSDVGIDRIIKLSFNKDIYGDTSAVRLLKYADDSTVSCDVVFSGKTVQITPKSELEYNSKYYVSIPSNNLHDNDGHYYAGLSKGQYSFTTQPSVVEVDFRVELAEPGNQDVKLSIPWEDEYFSSSATEYNNNLAVASLVLANSAYGGKDKVEKALGAFGCNNVDSYFNYSSLDTDRVGHAIGSKETIINGKACTVVAVVLRGTYGDFPSHEWFSNIIMQESGFLVAADRVRENLDIYFTKHGLYSQDLSDIKILITGHSRGAAVADILGMKVSDLPDFKKENVFVYGFATPNTLTVETKNYAYSNIHNIINAEDIVCTIPPFAWKYGVSYEFSYKNNSEMNKVFTMLTSGKDIEASMSSSKIVTAHKEETYLSFLLSHGNYGARNQVNIVSIKCPVDVEVYNSAGNIVGRVLNNIVDSSILTEVLVWIEGDVKNFLMLSDEIYTFKIVATDKGTMNYTVGTYDASTWDRLEEKEFKDVALNTGKIMSSTPDSTLSNTRLYVTDASGTLIAEILSDGSERQLLTKEQEKTSGNTYGSFSAAAFGSLRDGDAQGASNGIVNEDDAGYRMRYRVLANRLNVRLNPSLSAPVIGQLLMNEIVESSEQTQDGWAKVMLPDGRTGWSSMRYLSLFDGATKIGTLTTTARLNMRTGAGVQFLSLGILPKGASVDVTEYDGVWAIATINERKVYLHSAYLK